MKQKIIVLQHKHLGSYLENIYEYMKEGWLLKTAPAVIPAFNGHAPELIFILKKETEE